MNPNSYEYRTLHWEENRCVFLDQTKLPGEVTYLPCETYQEVIHAIRELIVRGAPAIGVAGAYAGVLAAKQNLGSKTKIAAALKEISAARPTAVNLQWAVKRLEKVLAEFDQGDETTVSKFLEEAKAIEDEDRISNQQMARFGADLLSPGSSVITYCNAGALATTQTGTALGVILEAYRQKKIEHVYTCETRPVLQGMRLTAWELSQAGVPFTVLCDNMAASLMGSRKISAIFVGADRVAANGDAANKVGTFGLALIAKHHGVPFYIVAPTSTIDFSVKNGNGIPIEQRSPDEVLAVISQRAPKFRPNVYNPAFDVTPASLIKAIICEQGVFAPDRIGDIKPL